MHRAGEDTEGAAKNAYHGTSVGVLLHYEQALMQVIAPPVAYGRRENADTCRLFTIQIVKNRATYEIIADVFMNVFSNNLKQRPPLPTDCPP